MRAMMDHTAANLTAHIAETPEVVALNVFARKAL
jgi:hypothetical protein